jgi:hypothetical protein
MQEELYGIKIILDITVCFKQISQCAFFKQQDEHIGQIEFLSVG